MTRLLSVKLIGCVLAASVASTTYAQQPSAPTALSTIFTVEGAVVSATRSTLVVLGNDGQYRLFVLDEDTARPKQIPPRSSVSVGAKTAEDGSTPVATSVTVTAAPPPPQASETPGQQKVDEPVPPAIRRTERSIQRQVSRFRIGVRGGAALDPELVTLGFHGQIGPFFSESVWARPNIEFGFGEVTDLVALNFEGIYRVPFTARQNRWSFFVGAGPALNFAKLGFTRDDVEPEDQFEFDDFDLDVGINFLGGVQSRDGMFLEFKATAYSTPHLRFMVGYNF